MKKLSVVVLVALLVSMVTYGQDSSGWTDDGTVVRLLTSTDKVGIGTTSPHNKLEIGNTFSFHDGGHEVLGLGYAPGYGDLNSGEYGAELRLDPTNGILSLGVANSVTATPSTVLSVKSNGRVGIGTTSPMGKLHVSSGTSGDAILYIEADTDNNNENDNPMIIFKQDGGIEESAIQQDNNVLRIRNSVGGGARGITFETGSENGYTNAVERMSISGTGLIKMTGALSVAGKLYAGKSGEVARFGDGSGSAGIYINGDDETVRDLGFCTHNKPRWILRTGGETESGSDAGSDFTIISRKDDGSFKSECLRIKRNNGNVGIGTANPQSKLAVNGTITAREIIVTQDGWPDFVFSDNHKLMPLNKLEEHVKINKSLPGIPTEKEVLKDGVKVGDMQAKLLEKIEELTLYVIELKKENEELRQTNEKLENRISALER